MFGYQEKSTKHIKRQNTQFEETEQASEPDMAEMLELSDQELKQLDYTKGSNGYIRQHAKTGGQCKQRGGTPKGKNK